MFTRGTHHPGNDCRLAMKEPIHNLMPAQLEAACLALGEPAWRATQVWHWLYVRYADDWEVMRNLPRALRAQLAERFLGEADMVLAEGFSLAPGVKIEILRRACGQPPRCAIDDGLIAIVTDMDEVYPQLPHFALDDIAGLAVFLLEHAAR